MTDKKKNPRKHVLVAKVTAGEKMVIVEFGRKNCVNVSALIRQLLFDYIAEFKP